MSLFLSNLSLVFKEVLDMMRERCLSPDVFTFSALAKACDNRHDAEQLLHEMQVNISFE